MVGFSAPPIAAGSRRDGTGGFTLLELLVGIAVMMLVLFVMSQLTENILQATRFSHQGMNAAQKARIALDSLGNDLTHLVDNRGMSVCVRPSGTSTPADIELGFLAQGRSPTGEAPARFLAVDYRLEGSNLVRSISPVAWGSIDFAQRIATSGSAGVQSVLASGILRFDAVAVLDNGSMMPVLTPGGAWLGDTMGGQAIPGGFKALQLANATGQRVRALVVAVAVLDDRARELLTDGGTALRQKLRAPEPGETPMDVWNHVVNSGSLEGFPRPVIAGLHFAQSTYELK